MKHMHAAWQQRRQQPQTQTQTQRRRTRDDSLWIHVDVCSIGLSHERLLTLRSIVKDSGIGVQGHSRTPVENARALMHVAMHQQRGLSFDAAIKAAAAAELASSCTLRSAAHEFAATGMLSEPDTSQR
jgi:hypothetical protein